MSSSRARSNETARATKFIAGLKKHFANVASLTFASAAHTPQELETAFQGLIDLRAAVDGARATVKAKLVAEAAERPSTLILMDGLEAFVKLTFSEQPDVLADFGVQPKKVKASLTAEQQAAVNAKRKSTREARGTAGSVQKKSVKGNVVGVVVTPVTSVPEPAASNAPVAPAPAGSVTGGSAGHGGA